MSTMPRWIKISAEVAGATATMAAATVAVGTLLWNRTTARSVKRLISRGMMIPMAAEVQRGLPEEGLSVWHGRIVTAEYQFTP
jgi:hypothetical protein